MIVVRMYVRLFIRISNGNMQVRVYNMCTELSLAAFLYVQYSLLYVQYRIRPEFLSRVLNPRLLNMITI